MLKQILLVGLGGGIGSILRFAVSLFSTKYFDYKFPIATITVNVIGSLLIGIILAYLHKTNSESSDLKFLLAIGFCGGFTTFSTFAWENLQLFNNQQYYLAIFYTLLSLLLCFIGVAGGYFLIKS
jgi:CrcB protein